MLVFLSWSGSRSKAVAEALQSWLKKVIQAVDPWISVEMEKGKRWPPEMADKLGQSNFGVFCLTTDNLNSPWLLFEAGAISKNKEATVCTFLLDLTPSELEYPLAQFQATVAEKPDILRLVKTINQKVGEAKENSLQEADLQDVFNTYWPKLEEQLKRIKAQKPAAPKPLRSEREMLEEILELLRGQTRDREREDDLREAQLRDTIQRLEEAQALSRRELAVQLSAMSGLSRADYLKDVYMTKYSNVNDLNALQSVLGGLGRLESKEEKKDSGAGSPEGEKVKKD